MKDKPDLIQPATFEPLEAQPTKADASGPAWGRYAILALVAAVLIVLFSAKSLTVITAPSSATTSLSGAFSIALGKRYLVWNGDYQLRASAPGFKVAAQSVRIDGADQQVQVDLQLLPDVVAFTGDVAATLSIAGEIQGVIPFELSLEAGDYELQFNAENYKALRQRLTIEGGGKRLALSPVLEPAWADVSVRTAPVGAQIYIADKLVGVSPATVAVGQGDQQLLLVLPGYKRHTLQVTAQAGIAQALPLVHMQKADARLMLTSKPTGAAVMIDGQYQGLTPLTLALQANKLQQMTLIKSGYQSHARSVKMQSARAEKLHVKLAARLGQVEIRHQSPDATLYINGVAQKSNAGIFKLASSSQRIELKQAGFVSYSKKLTPKPGFPQRLDIKLSAKKLADAGSAKSLLRVQARDGNWLRLLQPYNFTMGASRREAGRRANERLHQVTMDRAFYLAETEVTNAQFRQFSAQHSSGRVDDKSLNGEQQPVVNITWVQAIQYCNWLSRKEGLTAVYTMKANSVESIDLNANGYRLPTEAEWAWAARAGKLPTDKLLKFAWGQQRQPAEKAANIADSSAAQLVARVVEGFNDTFAVSAPVARFTPNQHALYDISGNVSEWVHDFYGQSQLSAAANTANPSGPGSGSFHVVRGASWRHGSLVELRLSYRDYEQKSRDDLGFRLARTAE